MTEMLVARRVHRPTTLGYKPVAMQPSDSGGSFSLDFGPFSGSENWSFQWLSRENLEF